LGFLLSSILTGLLSVAMQQLVSLGRYALSRLVTVNLSRVVTLCRGLSRLVADKELKKNKNFLSVAW